MRFRERLARFFYGRYGVDSLYHALFITYFVIWIIQIFTTEIPILYFSLAALQALLLFYMMFRVFSRNIYARRKENEAFLKLFRPIKSFFVLQKNKIRDRKHFCYVKCPHCKANLRLPKKKGEHSVICPRCKERFFVKNR